MASKCETIIRMDFVINSAQPRLIALILFGTITHIPKIMMIFARFAKKWSRKLVIHSCLMRPRY